MTAEGENGQTRLLLYWKFLFNTFGLTCVVKPVPESLDMNILAFSSPFSFLFISRFQLYFLQFTLEEKRIRNLIKLLMSFHLFSLNKSQALISITILFMKTSYFIYHLEQIVHVHKPNW